MTERDTKTALITGVLGQDGSYLAELLTTKGYQVIGTCHRGEQRTRLGGAAKEIDVLYMMVDADYEAFSPNPVPSEDRSPKGRTRA